MMVIFVCLLIGAAATLIVPRPEWAPGISPERSA